MRMRKKKHTPERIEACGELYIKNPKELLGKWNVLSKGRKLKLEIGCGKGKFICTLAQNNPDVFYIALEKVPDVAVMAMEKARDAKIENIRFICDDATRLCEFFDKGEIDDIYLNFSDPWPKKKQAKRRLTYRTYLDIYRKILKDDGTIFFKTDNRPLFDFSLEEFQNYGYELSCVTFDLHNSEYAEDNIMTEYEYNFSQKGFPINRLCAKKILDYKTEE